MFIFFEMLGFSGGHRPPDQGRMFEARQVGMPLIRLACDKPNQATS